jgi:CubicO group peptidase (beta-lactamase class C family)
MSGLSAPRLTRARDVLARHVDAGYCPGAVGVIARRGAVHVETVGTLAFEGVGADTPMAPDTICRLASTSKPLVAACAMTLVEDGTLRLDDPVDPLLPELADMTVLADPDGPLEDTVPARRPITLRDLLTFRLGTGMVLTDVPIAGALDAVNAGPPTNDEWLRGMGALPLVYQPGERWMYETGADVTVQLVRRATGKSFDEVLRERICEPLGMTDTGFSVPVENLGRLGTAYERDTDTGELVVRDLPDGQFSRPPVFEDGGGGLVSTADDFLAFASALLAGGTYRGERVLSRPAVTLMTSDQLTTAQREAAWFVPGWFDGMSWGFGTGVILRRLPLGASVGSYGWPGGFGTVWFNDPAEEMTVLLMIQRGAGGPTSAIGLDFWTAAYQAIDD